MARKTVLVTGVTGFLGGYVAEEFLAHGYDVRGTVRNADHPGVAELRDVAARIGGRFDVAVTSLLEDSGWDAAADGVFAVAHVASPAPKQRPRDPASLIRPAVEGTRRVLGAAARAGVARVVVTSSVDAVRSGHDLRDGRVLDEETWSVVSRSEPYAQSKTLAELAAWEVARDRDLELATLLPALVLGPIRRAETNVSVDVIRQLLAKELPALPRLGFAPVDVRDVALAHRLAIEVPAAAGRRYILASDPIWLGDIARVLDEEFGARGFDIPRRALPSAIVKIGARFVPTLRLAMPLLDAPAATSSERARSELEWTSRPAREAIMATAESLIALGVVAPTES
ncbi:MAG: NAD-dependent epimerase/dehydratase family protein [Pseudolysinimonas sp.]